MSDQLDAAIRKLSQAVEEKQAARDDLAFAELLAAVNHLAAAVQQLERLHNLMEVR